MKIKFFVCLFCLGVSICCAHFIYEYYKLHKAFEKYFTKDNCSLVMDKYYYINCYSFEHKGPKAIAYELEESILNLRETSERSKYRYDLEVPAAYRTYKENYIDNKYEKGHILSSKSMASTSHSQDSTFLMSNIVPQNYQVNQGLWEKAAQRERRVAKLQGSAHILNIILYPKEPSEIQYIKNRIAIPKYFIKIIKTTNTEECYAIPNENLQNQDLQFYKVDCKWFI
ncbi:DNA/RNA non-specific endonuclease [Helicobacter cappadocius]|uniref:DNA/RNA non-specific endonuclease n=1 Tax=Helicobacter cappadocius TaxID=3063998 RepID=A0AA90PTC7_9HELI|nr:MULTISPECIES: DNA/RNA non-specific endonuclease [unclassified Helicobacter]MDO7253235.1 DNA/RNA non-specific endonuclease [Helicobacter sp. faydin-H75]MDP2539159.1 DNA/RNA non-specific endonuclease [Helicobacter sp. faydin-H76]